MPLTGPLAQLLQSRDRGGRPRLVGQRGERLPTPQREGLLRGAQRPPRLTGGQQVTHVLRELFETQRVDLVDADDQPEPAPVVQEQRRRAAAPVRALCAGAQCGSRASTPNAARRRRPGSPPPCSPRRPVGRRARAAAPARRRGARHRASAGRRRAPGAACRGRGTAMTTPRPGRCRQRRYRRDGHRHLAASVMVAAGVPLPIVSKTLRHSTVSITSDTYSHMTREVALAAVDAMADVLAAAEAEAAATRRARAMLDGAAPTAPADRAGSPAHSPRTQNGELIM